MDYGNKVLDYYNMKGLFQDEVKALANKISSMFYASPNNSDVADALYRFPYGRAVNVVNMSPDDYIKQSYNTYHYNMPTSEITEPYHRFYNRIKSETLNGELLNKIKRGQKLDMPELHYDELGRGLGQEGNHRAMAAKLMGENNIPVAISTLSGNKGIGDAIKKNILKSLRFGGTILKATDPYPAIFDMLKLQGVYPYNQQEMKELRERIY